MASVFRPKTHPTIHEFDLIRTIHQQHSRRTSSVIRGIGDDAAVIASQDGQWVVLRVPYPNGFFTKWMDGRIDDPTTGWKGRGIWATVSTRAPFHMETGKGTTSKVVKFQIRTNPLEK